MKATEKKSASQDGAFVNEKMKDLPLHKFFIYELQDLYWAEKHLVEALPDMIEAATSDELKEAISHHLEQTKGHVTRLEQAFEALGEKAKDTKCKSMAGILKEAEDIVNETEDGSAVRDAAIIFAAQKVEHYEIASYGTLLAFSKLMGHTEVSRLLEDTLEEEEQTNASLTDLAYEGINEWALEEKD